MKRMSQVATGVAVTAEIDRNCLHGDAVLTLRDETVRGLYSLAWDDTRKLDRARARRRALEDRLIAKLGLDRRRVLVDWRG